MENGLRTTMIGSMPQPDASAALDALAEYPLGIAAWPQLPKRGFREGMIPQYTEGFPGVTADQECKAVWLQRHDSLLDEMAVAFEAIVSANAAPFAISADYAAGLHGFLTRVKEAETKLPAVKGHVTGPFTFGLGLNDNDKKAVWFDEQYRDIVYQGLGLKAVWQIEQLKQAGEQVYLFFDEPILSALGTPAYIGIQDDEVVSGLNLVYKVAHDQGALTGTHCCGNMDWSLLARTDVDIIAFDAYYFAEKVALYPEAVNVFLERGGRLAWGIVPTNDPELLKKETFETLAAKQEDLVKHFIGKGIDEKRVRDQALFTPSCGLGSLDPESASRALQLLAGFNG